MTKIHCYGGCARAAMSRAVSQNEFMVMLASDRCAVCSRMLAKAEAVPAATEAQPCAPTNDKISSFYPREVYMVKYYLNRWHVYYINADGRSDYCGSASDINEILSTCNNVILLPATAHSAAFHWSVNLRFDDIANDKPE